MNKLYDIDNKTFEKVATKFQIAEIDVTLNQSARLMVQFFNDDFNYIDSKELFLSEEEYNLWGQDDNYILELIENKLGIVIKNK